MKLPKARDVFTTKSLMNLCFMTVLGFLASVGIAAETSELSREQEEFANTMERQIMAACCLNGTLADHASPTADNQRRELRMLVGEGYSDEQILDWFVNQYGTEVLATPKIEGSGIFMYLLPVVGTGMVVMLIGGVFVLNLRRQAGGFGLGDTVPVDDSQELTPNQPESDDPIQQRLQQELRGIEDL